MIYINFALQKIASACMKKTIDLDYFKRGMRYEEYRLLIETLLKENKTTGSDQSPELFQYAKLNMSRMNRLDKTVELTAETMALLNTIRTTQFWILLTEGWCGDAAQSVPVIAKMAAVNPKIELRILLRDENLDLMDQYLQNGRSRSIPKLIAVNEKGEELFNWGPRPAELETIYTELKNRTSDFEVIKTELHKWYTNNKTIGVQEEICAALRSSAS